MATNEEDWFFESISRYKNINMFELEYPVHHMELTSSNSICVSCSNKKEHQLLELSLPLKLISQGSGSSEAVITNDNDLKIKCGIILRDMVFQLKTLINDRKLVASHVNTDNVTLYQLSSDSSDEIKKESVIKCDLESPFLGLSGSEITLTRKSDCRIYFINLSLGKIIRLIEPEASQITCVELVSPLYIDNSSVGLCYRSSGRVKLYDTRMLLPQTEISASGGINESSWNFTSLYECSDQSTSCSQSNCLAMVSDCGSLNVYDSRNFNTPYINENLGFKSVTASSVQLRLKQSDKGWISVSGFNENVHVYQLMPKLELAFVHDGHIYADGCSAETITSNHVWFPSLDNAIISSADNGSIQSWQFEKPNITPTVRMK